MKIYLKWLVNLHSDRSNNWRFFVNTVFILLSVLVLLYPAIENEYPILHSDSGTYLLAGFTQKVPLDRPIAYALFVRYASLGYSVWLVVIAQSLLVVLLLHQVIQELIGKRFSGLAVFVTASILAHTTGLGHYLSQIMADIFLSIGLLATLIILNAKRLTFLGSIVLIALTAFANGTHLSNIPIYTAVILLTVPFLLLFKLEFNRKRLIHIVLALAISWLIVPALSYSFGSTFSYSRVSYVIQFARLLEIGVARDFIKNKCETDPEFKLCKYLDKIDQYDRLDKFLWVDSSFLYDHPAKQRGWDTCWIVRNDEFKGYIEQMRREPGFMKYWFWESISGFGKQLITFNTKFFDPMGKGSHIRWIIDFYFKRDYQQYLGARQQSNTLYYDIQNYIQRITIFLSLLILALFISIKPLRQRSFNPLINTLLIIFFSAYFSSAAVVALFGKVTGRFQGRIIWILPMIIILLIMNFYQNKILLDAKSKVQDKNE